VFSVVYCHGLNVDPRLTVRNRKSVFSFGHLERIPGLASAVLQTYFPEPLIFPRNTVIEAFGKTKTVCGALEIVVPTGA
jgi:hypothetical protein